MISADRTWGEALLRFESVANPETGLTADQIEHFRSRLLGGLDEIVERIAALKAVRRVRNGSTADAVDSLLDDRAEAHRTEIESVTSALVAIEAGVFGICLRCHRPIGFEALSVQPTGRLCPVCDGSPAPLVQVPDRRGS